MHDNDDNSYPLDIDDEREKEKGILEANTILTAPKNDIFNSNQKTDPGK